MTAFSDLQPLAEAYSKLPAQAHRGSLAFCKLPPEDNEYYREGLEMFRNLVAVSLFLNICAEHSRTRI